MIAPPARRRKRPARREFEGRTNPGRSRTVRHDPSFRAPLPRLARRSPLPALAQGTQADYDRAAGLRARFSGKLTRSAVFPHWFGNHGEFWYKVGLGGGKSEYVIVDPAKGEKRVAVDLASLPGARATLPPLPPAETRGRDGGGETEIVFENRTSEAVRLFWVNGDAKVPYGEVKPESRGPCTPSQATPG